MGIKTQKILRLISKIILVLVGVGLIGFAGYYVYRSITFKPQGIVVTNITDSSATVTWTTASPMKGIVYVRKDKEVLPGPLGIVGSTIAYDDRDVSDAQTACVDAFNKTANETKDSTFSVSETFDCTKISVTNRGSYYVHSVTMTNLDENSTYNFVVGDGIWSFKNSVSTVKTFEVLEEVGEPSPIFGKVVGDDGTYSRDGLVYITFNDGSEGKDSIIYSSTTNDDGGWYLDASNVRDAQGNVITLELTNDSFKAKGIYRNYGNSEEILWILGYFNGAYPDVVVKKNIPTSMLIGKVFADCGYVDGSLDITGCIPDSSGNYDPALVADLGYGNFAKALATLNGTSTEENLDAMGLSKDAGNINALAGTVGNYDDIQECLDSSNCDVDVSGDGGQKTIILGCNADSNGACDYSASGNKHRTCNGTSWSAWSTGACSTNSACTPGDCQNDGMGNSRICTANGTWPAYGFGKCPVAVADTTCTAVNQACTVNGGKGRCVTDQSVFKCDQWIGDPCPGGTYNADGTVCIAAVTCSTVGGACTQDGEAGRCNNQLQCDKWNGDPCEGGTYNASGTCVPTAAVPTNCTVEYNDPEDFLCACRITCGDKVKKVQYPSACKKFSSTCVNSKGEIVDVDATGGQYCSSSVIADQVDFSRISDTDLKDLASGSEELYSYLLSQVNSLNGDTLSGGKVGLFKKYCVAVGGKYSAEGAGTNDDGAYLYTVHCKNIPTQAALNFVSKAYASDEGATNSYTYYLPELGLYKFQLSNTTLTEVVSNGSSSYLLYVEGNGESGYQPPTDPDNIQSDEDYILSQNIYKIAYTQETTAQQYDIKEGINLISFNFIANNATSGAYTAEDVITQAANNGVTIQYIATFDGGRWNEGYSCSSDTCTGNNFTIVPGKGYLVYATDSGTITIPGYNLTSSIPVAFSAGWNLVGVHGYTTAYTARSFIDSINTISGLVANNVSWWPTSKSKYEGLQVDNGTQYGLDFSISPANGYFVRISNYAPSDTTCKSLIWQAGGSLNGTCGNTK